MSTVAIKVMIAVCGVVWGGFCYLLARALRSESAKQQDG